MRRNKSITIESLGSAREQVIRTNHLATVRPAPIATSMLETTKLSRATVGDLLNRLISIDVAGVEI